MTRAIGPLAEYLRGWKSDPDRAVWAALALGKIGGRDAAAALDLVSEEAAGIAPYVADGVSMARQEFRRSASDGAAGAT